ncbi:hypothetical protein DFH11DRAFT_1808463 [Phellopilus nigrolimitatus]|nr:hypothetical protein DFH11DRAFT_1808463 [Phellopilus nigrolimitatus]
MPSGAGSAPPSSPSLQVVPSSSSAASTLRSLYPRAARALLQRDIALTHTLLDSAFALLPPPLAPSPDALDPHRRKWDILRITLETSVFASPPPAAEYEALPPPLRANLMMSAQSLVAALHSRSVRLFSPAPVSPTAAYLPAQMLVPLVLSSLKLHCPDVGRSMIEDWLALRESVEKVRDDAEGYKRILELFCLHVLPRLQDWEYSRDFLEYERELPPHFRQALRKQEIDAARTIPTPPSSEVLGTSSSSSSLSSRSPSPAPSTSSNSSADTNDTHSTRTVVPRTPRPKHGLNGFTPLTPTPSTSSVSLSDVNRKYENGAANGYANGHAVRGKRSLSPASTARGDPSGSRSRPRSARTNSDLDAAASRQRAITARNSSSIFTLIKTSLRPYFTSLSASHLVFALLFVFVPLVSFVLRRRRRASAIASPSSPADEVRRRLQRSGEQRAGVLGALWGEVVRAVADAVRMAGGGLV